MSSRIEWWKIWVGAAVTLTVALVPILYDRLRASPPVPDFKLENPFIFHDDVVRIFANNKAAQRRGDLDIDWNGYVISNSAHFTSELGIPYAWTFVPSEIVEAEDILSAGPHTLRFAFSDTAFSAPVKIRIQSLTEADNTRRASNERASTSITEEKLAIRPRRNGIALVIGIDDYKFGRSRDGKPSAQLISSTLHDLGFFVIEIIDPGKIEILDHIEYISSIMKKMIHSSYIIVDLGYR